jgi:serine/threonine-protein kinase
MTDDPRIQQLLDELLDSHATPEHVCGAYPELLPVVRARWQQVCRLRADLDALLPPTGDPSPRPPERPALPQISGYEVEGVLGRGGMGVVFRARHLRLNRPVALKMILAGAYAGPRERGRFQREAEAVAGLRHPNIVQVHEAGEHDGQPYFTMEFVEGGSLARKLMGQPQPARGAAELVATLAGAVQFAHACGIIHRDLKPANILLTADGTPKVSDFGLARRVEAGPEFTASGARVGTPSYMAPEQALGKNSEVGPAADVYALGAILYELLTGRPPFRGESPAETERQVITEEPAPLSRSNPQVPRDLETICLKCLHKSPARRYHSARDLAEDLGRFLEGKPVRARPVGTLERAVKWARRRPAAALLVGALMVMLGAGIGTGAWVRQQEADRRAAKAQREGQAREAVETALRRADDLRREERWQEALVVLTDASPQLAEADSPLLETRLRRAQSDFRIADDLRRAQESRPRLRDAAIDYQQRAAEYRGAFEHAGLGIDDAEAVADSIRASAIRDQLVAAVDDRAFVAFMLDDGPLVERLLRAARSVDPEPRWRDRFRDPAAWKNRDRLLQLAADAFHTSPPPSEHQLALLGLLLRQAGARNQCTQLLGEACRRQPKNFWVHCEMGFALLLESRWLEASGYYRVAVTLRPSSGAAHEGLGMALFPAGQVDEAIAAYRRAVELSPKVTPIHTRLVNALANAGYWDEARAACRRAIEIDPGNHLTPYNFAEILFSHGRVEDAVVMGRKAAEIAPDVPEMHVFLGVVCAKTDRREEAVKAFRKVTELKAWQFMPEKWLAQELAAVGRRAEAIAVLQSAAERDPKNVSFTFDAGRLLRLHREPEAAARGFEKAATTHGLIPEVWEELAGARLDQGRFAEARAATERLLELPANDAERRARRRQLEFCDSLLAVADLPAVLAGKERPTEASTLRALAEWCFKHKRLTATAAGFYGPAFTAQPSLAEDLEAADRLDAARAAALAGCGVGEDVAELGGEKRAALRTQALQWLTAEYTAWAERHRLGKPGQRTLAATAVRSWQRDDDLAGVRDEQALASFPTDERRAWQALWSSVAALAARDPVAKFDQARAHVARLEWRKAVTCYAEGFELEPTDNGDLWFEYAASQLLAGDRVGYRRTCAHMLGRCQQAPQMSPYLAARACTLAPDSTDDPTQPLRLSAKELERNDAASWARTEQAALRVRTGRSQDAVPLLERSLVADGRPGRAVLNWLWLALAHQKTGKPDEARRWRDRAADWLDQQGDRMPHESAMMGSHRHNWLEAHALRREVDARLR